MAAMKYRRFEGEFGCLTGRMATLLNFQFGNLANEKMTCLLMLLNDTYIYLISGSTGLPDWKGNGVAISLFSSCKKI